MTSYSVTRVGGAADVMSRLAEAQEGAGDLSAFTPDAAIAEDPVLYFWLLGCLIKEHPRQDESPQFWLIIKSS